MYLCVYVCLCVCMCVYVYAHVCVCVCVCGGNVCMSFRNFFSDWMTSLAVHHTIPAVHNQTAHLCVVGGPLSLLLYLPGKIPPVLGSCGL